MKSTKKNQSVEPRISLQLRKPRKKRPELVFDYSKVDPNFLDRMIEYFDSEEFAQLKLDLEKNKKLKEIYKKKANHAFEYKGFNCRVIRTKEGYWGIATSKDYPGVRREEPNISKQAEIDALKEQIDLMDAKEMETMKRVKQKRVADIKKRSKGQ